jgi:ribosomal protein L37AE/L43A
MGSYSADQRRALAQAVRAGDTPECPECGTPVAVRPVERPNGVSYVRHRVWLLCPSCKRTAAVDRVGRGGEPGPPSA